MTIKELLIAFEVPEILRRMVMGAVVARKPELVNASLNLHIDKDREIVRLSADGISWWEGTFDQAEAWFNGQQKADAGSGPGATEASAPARPQATQPASLPNSPVGAENPGGIVPGTEPAA